MMQSEEEKALVTAYQEARKAYEEASVEAVIQMEKMTIPGCVCYDNTCGSFLDRVLQASDRVTEIRRQLSTYRRQMA